MEDGSELEVSVTRGGWFVIREWRTDGQGERKVWGSVRFRDLADLEAALVRAAGDVRAEAGVRAGALEAAAARVGEVCGASGDVD